MKKEILVLVAIILLTNSYSSLAQDIESIIDLKEEIHDTKKAMGEDVCGRAYLQNTLANSEELIRNYELLNLDGRDLAHLLNHVLDFIDTAESAGSKFEEGEFNESRDKLHRLESLKKSVESKKSVLVTEGYNEYYIDDILKNMDRTVAVYGEKKCLDLMKKADDSSKLDEKLFFLGYAVSLCCEYKSEECGELRKQYKDIENEIGIKEQEAEEYEDYGDSNLTAARNTAFKISSLIYYDKSIESYDEGYNIYEHILGMRTADATRFKEQRDSVKWERRNVFQEVLVSYSTYLFIYIIIFVLLVYVTRNYRREIRLNTMIKKVF
ncbi:MAG TPA: hypothetical protein ENL10_00835 [Candidatus Cloacimonetes bacterium]|nr:hypothetical protein [Candidatus Cloacimonadota bacterium]